MSQTYNRAFFDGLDEICSSSAAVIAALVTDLLRPTSVVDVGCGRGIWLAAFKELGATDVLGIDGAYVDRDGLRIPADRFMASDLGSPLVIQRQFDLAVSLEVAEHLPEPRAAGFVADLAALAPCILFSAAIPFQGGNHHQNEQWQDYWARLFAEHDFMPIDCLRPKVWADSRVAWFYAQNAILYVRRSRIEVDAALRTEYERSRPWPLRLVHPYKYLSVADITGIPLRRALGWLPLMAYRGLRRTFGRHRSSRGIFETFQRSQWRKP